MTKGKRVNTVEAKNRLNELIARAGRTKQPVIVEKRGAPVAVVLDYGSYQKQIHRQAGLHGEELVRALEALHRHLGKKYPSGTGDAAAILREVRHERSRA